MRVQVFQHVAFEGLASMGRWFERRSARVAFTRFHGPPDLRSFDMLMVLGGPMGVNDEKAHPWLAVEKAAIAAAIGAGKRVLGVCLGAQLIAASLGARLSANPWKEVGWFPVRRTADAPRAGCWARRR